MTQKNISFQLFDACKVSFQKLIDLLILYLILALPKKGVEFIIICDASGVGVGVVLMQKSKLIM